MSSPLADLIQRGESGSKSYDNYNRGTYLDGNGRERIRGADSAIDFSAMTVGEVMDLQALPRGDANRLFAVGRYQVIPATMSGAVAALGIRRDEPFTDALQDRIFSDYLITDKRSPLPLTSPASPALAWPMHSWHWQRSGPASPTLPLDAVIMAAPTTRASVHRKPLMHSTQCAKATAWRWPRVTLRNRLGRRLMPNLRKHSGAVHCRLIRWLMACWSTGSMASRWW